MKKTLITTLFCGLLLCLGLIARGQTDISLSGPDPVCAHSSHSYTVSYFGDQPDHYSWTVVRGYVALDVPPNSKDILWGIPGTGTITVIAFDTLNHPIDTATMDVTILPVPVPAILTGARLACEPLEIPEEGAEFYPFIDSPCQKVCAYSEVIYTATGDPSSTYVWTIFGGDEIASSGQTCTVRWNAPGPGKIIVEETNIYGCKGEATTCIDIIDAPVAHMVALPDTNQRHFTVCMGSEVIFFDYSKFAPTSPITAWRWEFGDGSFSNEKGGPWAPISHTYNNPGQYTVILTVTNQCGCSTSDTLLIDVDPSPGVEIVCPGVVCENDSFIYHVNATCPGGSWQVIGGTIVLQSTKSLTIIWDNIDPATGYGYIIYDPAGSCPGLCPAPVAKKIPVVKTTADIQGPDYICLNQQFLYSLPQWPTTRYVWSINNSDVILMHTDQPNEAVLVPKPTASGTVTLTCNYTNTLLGCSGTASKVITIPGAVVITDTVFEFCQGVETVYHIAGPNASTGEWTILKPDHTTVTGSGDNFPIMLDLIGTYLLSVKGDFCPIEPKEIKVLGHPDAPEFIEGPNRICRGIPTTYKAGIIDNKHYFEWSISNGSLNIPVGDVTDVTLNPAGGYPFTLSVQRVTKDKPHCVSAPTELEIQAPYVIFFVNGEDTVCPSQIYPYFVSSVNADSYFWNIYPQTMGSVDAGQGTEAVKILWNKQDGWATLVCKIKKCNVEYTDSMLVYVRNLALNLTLSTDTVCMNEAVFAQVNVSTTSGVRWDIGERTFKTPAGSNTNNLYWSKLIKDYTKYHVTAVVDSPWGCYTPVSAKDSVVVVPAPAVYITPPGAIQGWCEPVDVIFTAVWDTNGIAPLSYTWEKNSVTISTDTFIHATDTGRYQLILPGPYGCNSYPYAKVKPSNCSHPTPPCDTCTPPSYPICTAWGWLEVTEFISCKGLVSFKRHISNPAMLINGWWWPSNDTLALVESTDSTATYIANRAGAYRFNYHCNFYDNMGGAGNCPYEADTMIVFPMIANLEVKPACTEYSPGVRWVELIDHSTSIKPFLMHYFQLYVGPTPADYPTIAQGPNMTYFLHPDTLALHNPEYRLVILNADSLYCGDDVAMQIPALPTARFNFTRDTTCEEDAAVYFTNFSLPYPSALKHDWDFDDLSGNKTENPYRVYADPKAPLGNPYRVTLTVTDRWGCPDDTTRDVMIKERKIGGKVNITPNYPCEHTVATATHTINANTTTPLFYEWHDNSTSYGKTFDPVNYMDIYKSGYYYTYVEDKYGCALTTPGDTVLFSRVAPAYIAGGEDQCQDVPFTLTAFVGNISGLTYQWERNSTVITGVTGPDLTQNMSTPGTYTYRVTTSVPNPGGGFCTDVSDDFVVTVHGTPAKPSVSFSVLDCNDYTVELNASHSSSGTFNWSNGMNGTPVEVHHGGPYQVTFTDQYGCTSKEQLHTPRDLRVYLWIFPTGCYSLCPSDPNIITGPIITFKQWNYLHNGVPFVGGPVPYNVSLNPTGPGVYNMYLEDDWCNVTSGDMNVDTNCLVTGAGSIFKPGREEEHEPISAIPGLASALPALQLAPNPAGNSTHVSYNLPGKNETGYMEVYDVAGRIMFGRKLQNHRGSFDIDLGHFAPGIYHVILRQGGEILLHQNLSVTH